MLCSVEVDKQSGAGVSWIIDETGAEVPGTRVLDDAYRLNQNLPDGDPDKLPDPDDFKLEPFELTASTPGESTPDGTNDSSGAEDDAP